MRSWLTAVDAQLFARLPLFERWRFTLIALLTLLVGLASAHAGYSIARDFAGTLLSAVSGGVLAFVGLNLLRLIFANCAPELRSASAGRPPAQRARQTIVVRYCVAAVVSLIATPPLTARMLAPRLSTLEKVDISRAIEIEHRVVRERYRSEMQVIGAQITLATADIDATRRRLSSLNQPALLARMPEATRRKVEATIIATQDELQQRIQAEEQRVRPRLDSLRAARLALEDRQSREIAAIAARPEFATAFTRRTILMFRRVWYSYPLMLVIALLFLVPVWLRLQGPYAYDRLIAAEGYRTVARSYLVFLQRYSQELAPHSESFSAPHEEYLDPPFNTQPRPLRIVSASTLVDRTAPHSA